MAIVTTESEMQEFIKLCSTLESFVRYVIKAEPSEQQLRAIRDIDNGEKMIAVKSGHGCFGLGTKILKANGKVVNVEDIKVGDKLMGDDGNSVRNVLELYRGQEEMYRFTYMDGTSHVFNKSHILCLVSTQTHGKQKAGDRVTIKVSDWLKWSDRKKRTHAVYRGKVEFLHKILLIHPYLLGVWLGDGNSRDDRVYLGDKKKEVAKAVGGVFVERRNNCDCIKLGIREALKVLGVLNNKHIPCEYLTASREDRLALLAGLLDTDGSLDKTTIEITQKRKVLAEGIVYLSKSLGLHATLKPKVVKGVTYWRVHITRNIIIIPCLRLKTQTANATQRNNLHFGIRKVEPLGVGDYYGFELDGNHKFLGGDFTVLHNTGKSAFLSWLALWTGITKYDAKVPITAPSAPQLKQVMLSEIRKWSDKLPKVLKNSLAIKIDSVDFNNGNFIALRTARKETPEALQGFHATNLVFAVDEASGVDETLFEVIDGALTGEHNILVMIGNPTRTSGRFYDAFHRHKHLYSTHTFNAELSPNVTKKSIEKKRQQYGYDSDIYRVRVLGEFPRASSDTLFPVELLEEALKREEYDKSGAEVWGLDIARFGDDASVLAKRKGYYLRPLIQKRNLDTKEVADWISGEYAKSYTKPIAIFVDTIGIGVGVFDTLLHRGLPVYDGNVGRKTAEFGLLNKRIEMYKRLAEKMQYMRFAKEDDELLGDLSSIKYEIDDKGIMRLEPKAKTKERLGRSPDKADAVALTWYDELFLDDELNQNEEQEDLRMQIAREAREENYDRSW